MASLAAVSTPSCNSLKVSPPTHHRSLFSSSAPKSRSSAPKSRTYKSISLRVQAANLPAGVENPKVEPKLVPPFLGWTKTAEIWNSRACMMGLIGTFIVELILNKGILEIIGVEIGKGLDIPL